MPAFDFKRKPNHKYTYYNPFLGPVESRFYSEAKTSKGLMRAAIAQLGHDCGTTFLSTITSIDGLPVSIVSEPRRTSNLKSYQRV